MNKLIDLRQDKSRPIYLVNLAFYIEVNQADVDGTGELLGKFHFLIVVKPGNNINSAFIF